MKTIIVLLTACCSFSAFAGGSGGGGVLSPHMRAVNFSLQSLDSGSSGIVYYQGQINDNIYFQYGSKVGKRWNVEKYRIDMNDLNLVDQTVIDALARSQATKAWSKLNQGETFQPSSK